VAAAGEVVGVASIGEVLRDLGAIHKLINELFYISLFIASTRWQAISNRFKFGKSNHSVGKFHCAAQFLIYGKSNIMGSCLPEKATQISKVLSTIKTSKWLFRFQGILSAKKVKLVDQVQST